MPAEPLDNAFSSHPRRWRDLCYVYPVISRRSAGLSIGVNLNPDGACNFNCVYCCADPRHRRPGCKVDLPTLEAELRHLVETRAQLFDEPEFRSIPPDFRRLNDIAFSGDGEPTAVPAFPGAIRIATAVRRDYGLADAKIVVITNACYLTRPAVTEAIALLDQHNGEIWAKLDAGTEEYFRLVNRPNFTLQHVLDNILATALVRPIALQSLFVRVRGESPPPAEIAAYVERLRWLVESGARLSMIQVYTVARRTAEPYATPASADELEAIAAKIRPLHIPVTAYH